jgi:GNAT superfamily N-acetyltransferase
MAGCVALLAEVHRADDYPAHWPDDPARWLTPAGSLAAWVAYDGTVALGHVVLAGVDDVADADLMRSAGRPSSALAQVKRLFVHPATRGRGIARTLLETAARDAFERALHPVLETTADRPETVRFYEGAGWRRIGNAIAQWSMPSGEHPLMQHFEFPAP